MATVDVKDTSGKKVGTAELADAVFAIAPNTFAVHQVVRSQMAARRQGTHDTKGRSEVSGGGAKPWRQKGTGRARQGSIRAGQWKGGGVIFGPTPRSYAFKVPNKVVKLAMRSVLSAKTADGELYVIDGFGITEPSTKQAAAVLKALGIEKRVTVVVENDDMVDDQVARATSRRSGSSPLPSPTRTTSWTTPRCCSPSRHSSGSRGC